MEVILREDIDKLGSRGAGREGRRRATPAISCCPRSWPSRPPSPTRRSWSRSARRTCARKPRRKGEAEDLSKLLTGVSVTIRQKAGENDQLFGSVTSKDVADALAAANFTIDRRKVQLDEPIKQLGEYKVPVRLHRDVTAEITVVVAKEE